MKSRTGLVMIAVMLLALFITASRSEAGVEVGVGINLPAYTFAAPPPMAVIPGTYAYFAPDARIDIVFYDGYWYRPYNGRWFRAHGYNGPWAYTERVPRTIMTLPPHYRSAYRSYPRIGYRDFHSHWRNWQKERYWDRDERWREGRHHGHGER